MEKGDVNQPKRMTAIFSEFVFWPIKLSKKIQSLFYLGGTSTTENSKEMEKADINQPKGMTAIFFEFMFWPIKKIQSLFYLEKAKVNEPEGMTAISSEFVFWPIKKILSLFYLGGASTTEHRKEMEKADVNQPKGMTAIFSKFMSWPIKLYKKIPSLFYLEKADINQPKGVAAILFELVFGPIKKILSLFYLEELQKENEQLRNDLGNLQEKMTLLQKENDDLRRENEWRRARDERDDITLSADTAHPNLSIDKKSLKYESQPQQVPANPERFDSIVCVLGSEGFSSGKHYWEVDVRSSTDWDLGVSRKSIERKGKISLSPKEGYWALGLRGRDYWAKTDPWTRVVVQKKPQKIGVYLSYQEGRVTFFSVTDMSVLFTFSDCSFSGEVYPFFKNSHKETTMKICSNKEED